MSYWLALTCRKNAESLLFLRRQRNMVADIGCPAGELEYWFHGNWLGLNGGMTGVFRGGAGPCQVKNRLYWMHLLRLKVHACKETGYKVQGSGAWVQGTWWKEGACTKLKLELLNKQTPKDTSFGGSATSPH